MQIPMRYGRFKGGEGLKGSKSPVTRYFHERHDSKVLEKPVAGYVEIRRLHFFKTPVFRQVMD